LARAFRAPSIGGTRRNIFRKARFLHFDGPNYLAGTRQALLEKFAKEFSSRIGGDNFVDGLLHGSRIPLGLTDRGLTETAENQFVRFAIDKIDHKGAFRILLDIGVHCPSAPAIGPVP